MAEVDRRGFFRILRRADPTADETADQAAEAAEMDPQIRELADLTARLLADVGGENDPILAEGTLLTGPHDLAYMRVTPNHIVFAIVTGFSVMMRTADVRALDVEPPVESMGYGELSYTVLRAHHPADLEHVTRSYAFRFRPDSPLLAAIRETCDIPEPEPEPEADADGADAGPAAAEPERSAEPRA
jgi:hypothetical protein